MGDTKTYKGGCHCGRVKAMYAVNVRCLEGVDIGALKLTHFDGRSL